MKIVQLALKDLKLLLRDRMGAFFILGFPIMMGLFFGLMMGGFFATAMELQSGIAQQNSQISK